MPGFFYARDLGGHHTSGATGSPGDVPLHNSLYDFNDAFLPIQARGFARVAHQRWLSSLPRPS